MCVWPFITCLHQLPQPREDSAAAPGLLDWLLGQLLLFYEFVGEETVLAAAVGLDVHVHDIADNVLRRGGVAAWKAVV